MAHDLAILDEQEVILCYLHGELDNATYHQFVPELEKLARDRKGYSLVLAFDQSIAITIDSELVSESSKQSAQFSESSKRVLVAPSELSFGMSRLFVNQVREHADQYLIVRSIEAAAQALNLELNVLLESLAELKAQSTV